MRDSCKPKGGQRRIAADGKPYTQMQFCMYFGNDTWRLHWEAARRADVPQPARTGAGPGPLTWGNNHAAVRKGIHSRFHRHLQLQAGSKTMAELIIFTGCYNPQFLAQANKDRRLGGAAQPAEARSAEHLFLKRAADNARREFRKAKKLREKLTLGLVDENDLDGWQQHKLQRLQDGTTLRRVNQAVAAYGHGTVRSPHWPPSDPTHFLGGTPLRIGGSTGGTTREILDNHTGHDVQAFLNGR